MSKLPYHYDFEIKEHFGKGTKVSYNPDRSEVSVTPAYSAESELTYENYKFLADLFKTTNVTTDIFISQGGGCPTCDGDSASIDTITFYINNAIVEVSDE
jgi:hypothetical protein